MYHVGVLFVSILNPDRLLKTCPEKTQPKAHCIFVNKALLEQSGTHAFWYWQGCFRVTHNKSRLPSEPGLLTQGLYRKSHQPLI